MDLVPADTHAALPPQVPALIDSPKRTPLVDTKAQAERSQDKQKLAESERHLADLQTELEEAKEATQREKARADCAEEENAQIHEEYLNTLADCRRLTAELIELRPAVWTFFRIRPSNKKDENNPYINLKASERSKNRSTVVLRGSEFGKQESSSDIVYTFDRVFHETESNAVVWEYTKPLVEAALSGRNVGIFLDGPSGSGKSYIALEPPAGIAYDMARYILQSASFRKQGPRRSSLRLWCYKVYKDKIYEATDKTCKTEFSISNATGTVTAKEGVEKIKSDVITSAEALERRFKQVFHNSPRTETVQNNTSSRCHTVCILEFSGQTPDSSCLFLVDLAGPESLDEASNKKETIGISQNRNGVHDCLEEMFKIRQWKLSPEEKEKRLEALRLQLKRNTV